MKGEEKEAVLEAKVFCFITQGTWCCQELVSASRQRLAIWDWAPSSESRSSLPACPVCPSLQHMHLPSRIPFWNLLPHPLLPHRRTRPRHVLDGQRRVIHRRRLSSSSSSSPAIASSSYPSEREQRYSPSRSASLFRNSPP